MHFLSLSFFLLCASFNLISTRAEYCPDIGNCCNPHSGTNCTNICLFECVIERDSSCGTQWGENCVARVEECLVDSAYVYGSSGISNENCTESCPSSCRDALLDLVQSRVDPTKTAVVVGLISGVAGLLSFLSLVLFFHGHQHPYYRFFESEPEKSDSQEEMEEKSNIEDWTFIE